MGLVQLIILSIVLIGLGQILLYKTRNFKVFYITHLVLMIGIVIVSFNISGNQSGGVSWPWWFFSVFPFIPVVISLLVGTVILLMKRSVKVKKGDI